MLLFLVADNRKSKDGISLVCGRSWCAAAIDARPVTPTVTPTDKLPRLPVVEFRTAFTTAQYAAEG